MSARVDWAKLDHWQAEDPFEVGKVVGLGDIESFGTLMGATGNERGEIYIAPTAGKPPFYDLWLTEDSRELIYQCRRVRNFHKWK